MQILLTGGTGLIGRALCHYWQTQGHGLWVWSRRPADVERLCGPGVNAVAQLADIDRLPLDAIVNLAGAPIADRPWTEGRRHVLTHSRVDLTAQLLAWCAEREHLPATLLSGSAVGWYGDAGEQALTESSPPAAEDFASRLCQSWEQMAQRGAEMGMRVVLLRTGIVLARDGGFLPRLLTPFRLGLGGRLGDGQQWMPWIHLEDQVRLIDHLLHQHDARGPYNACAPEPVRNRDFVRELARQLHRPAVLPVPAVLLKTLLGELGGLILASQRAFPERLLAEGFRFHHDTLPDALQALLEHRKP